MSDGSGSGGGTPPERSVAFGFPGRVELDRVDVVLLTGLLAVFGALSGYFFEFVLDDAYITLRYARHLATGHGIVWNVGADPVEGYTSTLWMLVAAVGHLLGAPVLFLKVVGLLSTVAVIVGLFLYGTHLGAGRAVVVPVCATVALSPAIAVITVQGMETPLAMLFVLVAATAAVSLTRAFTHRRAALLGAALLAGMLTRPGLVIFAGGVLAGLFVGYHRRDRTREAMLLVAHGTGWLFVPGLVFLGARWAYFGYVFPNSFYIKEASGLVSAFSIRYLAEFMAFVAGPVSLVVLFALVRDPKSDLEQLAWRVGPVVVGTAGFLAMWVLIAPLQGFFWRFQQPVLPAILVVVTVVAADLNDRRQSWGEVDAVGDVSLRQALLVAFVLWLTLVPMHTLDDAYFETQRRDPANRVAVGQALDEVDGDYRLLVTESGAVPYYSRWHAVDYPGLNSERAAHGGFDRQFLREYDPDLVMLGAKSIPGFAADRSPVVSRYLGENGYHLVAVIRFEDTNRDHWLVFFADPDSEGYREIVCSLLTIDGVGYADTETFANLARPDVAATDLTRSDCQ